MIEELCALIEFIQKEYDKNEEEWKKNENYKRINLKKTTVKYINADFELLSFIYDYRKFLDYNNITMKINKFKCNNSKINSRIKTQNSIY